MKGFEGDEPPPKIVILVPTRDGQVSVETHKSLSRARRGIDGAVIFSSRLDVVSARNALAADALLIKEHTPSVEFALMVDSDAWWPSGTIESMCQAMRAHPDFDVMTGYFCERRPFFPAGAFSRINVPSSIIPYDGELETASQLFVTRFNCGDVVEVEAVALHFAMVRLSLVARLGNGPFDVHDGALSGEDIAFCTRVRSVGGRIACHTGLPVGHVDVRSGLTFFPLAPPCRITSTSSIECDNRPFEFIRNEWNDRDIREGRSYGEAVDRAHRRAVAAWGSVWGWTGYAYEQAKSNDLARTVSICSGSLDVSFTDLSRS
jgi:hypothetical protein